MLGTYQIYDSNQFLEYTGVYRKQWLQCNKATDVCLLLLTQTKNLRMEGKSSRIKQAMSEETGLELVYVTNRAFL